MIMTETTTDLSILCCGNCGKEVLSIGKNFQLFIPSIQYKCLDCGSTGIFDKVISDTTDVKEVEV